MTNGKHACNEATKAVALHIGFRTELERVEQTRNPVGDTLDRRAGR